AHDAVQQDETSAVDACTEQRGNGATQREAKDYRPRQVQHRDQLAQIIDVLIQRVADWRFVAEPMPTEIGGHEPNVRRQLLRQGGECVGTHRGAMDAENGRLAAWPIDNMQCQLMQRYQHVPGRRALDDHAWFVTLSKIARRFYLELQSQDALVTVKGGFCRCASAEC